jgi:hypothetical protein
MVTLHQHYPVQWSRESEGAPGPHATTWALVERRHFSFVHVDVRAYILILIRRFWLAGVQGDEKIEAVVWSPVGRLPRALSHQHQQTSPKEV